MSERRNRNPEASPQMVEELYQHAAGYLEHALYSGVARRETTQASYKVRIAADVPASNGRSLQLSYERTHVEHRPMVVDAYIPLFWIDDNGTILWHTPISIDVRQQGELVHTYEVVNTGVPGSSYAQDSLPVVTPGSDQPAGITALHAKELTAQLDWAMEGKPS